jgi:hypothetical protein
LSTPPMHPGTSIECFASNISSRTVKLLIEMVDQDGGVLSTRCVSYLLVR